MNLNLEWSQHPANPLIKPVWPEWLVGDPVVVPPEKSPDGGWHLFSNTITRVIHYTSRDGIKWRRKGAVCAGMRAFILEDNGEYFLFNEDFTLPWRTVIKARRSRDLMKWSAPQTVLKASLKWEGGFAVNMSCPCVVKDGSVFRLYYSANQVFLPDLGFGEPEYIGVAESDNIMGPYKKRSAPIISPDHGNKYRNLGAGAIKVYRDDENDRWIGFNNGIYEDDKKRSRSAIMLLESKDGLEWKAVSPEPVISPGNGWRKALVYQLCMVERPDGEMWIYYNARDGWRIGVERIGLEIGRTVIMKN